MLRSVDPSPAEVAGRTVTGLRRLGKRIVIELEGDCFVLIHLMIAGRLHWKEAGAKLPGKIGLAAFDFSTGTLTLTEAGSKRRAAIHLVRGEAALAAHDPGGLELFEADLATFRAALTRESPHAQAVADRSPHPERDRQRLLRRDPAPGAPLTGEADAAALRGRDRAALRGGPRYARGLDRAIAPRARRARSRKG